MSRPVTRAQASNAMAQLVPRIVRGTQLDFFLKRGVTQTQFLVLMGIHADGRCTMGTLARNMHVQMPTATGIIDRLIRMGYVRRISHPQDRRQVFVELTAKGQAFVRDFQAVIRRRWKEVLRSLEPRELATFHQVVTKLTAQL